MLKGLQLAHECALAWSSIKVGLQGLWAQVTSRKNTACSVQVFLPYALNLLLSLGGCILAVLQGYPMNSNVLFILR